MKFYLIWVIECMKLLLCINLITSCKIKENNNREATFKSVVENCLGKKLILPDSLRTYSPFSNYIADSMEVFNSKTKIYSLLNASCPTYIQNIVSWDSIVPDFSKYKVPVILICESKDNFELIEYLHEKKEIKKFSYPLFFDFKNEFYKKNSFMKKTQHFETVLTDKENNILLLGNPIRSKETKDLYLKEIKRRINLIK